MVLADPEEVHADLVGQDPLLDDVPYGLGVGQRAVVLVVGDVAKRVQAEDQGEPHWLGCGGDYVI